MWHRGEVPLPRRADDTRKRMTNRIDPRDGMPAEEELHEHNPNCSEDDPCLDCIGYERRIGAIEDRADAERERELMERDE
jgi:hypothetical protein